MLHNKNELMDKFSGLVDRLEPTIHSVIIKYKDGEVSMGKMTKTGSYHPFYSGEKYPEALAYLVEHLLSDLQSIYTEYRSHNERKHTLYFRYNRQRDALELFTASSMVLSSKVY
jgi:hypothetical protein